MFFWFQDLDVVITSVQPGQAYPASLSNRVEDFRAMLSNPSTWLDDHAMDHAQALLKVRYPNINGLYATTSLALLSTLPEPAQGFVQILNVSANHWVTVSDIGCQGGSVNIFDSLGHTRTEVFIEQVTGLLAFPGKSVRLQWPDIQQQAGGSDCGLFAIANSFALCSGEGPSTVQYHQGQMRSHLFSCFQAGEVQLFPRAMRSPTAEPFAIDVDVHCLCRRTIGQGKAPLVPCRRCDRPFHQSCLFHVQNIYEYICPNCQIIF